MSFSKVSAALVAATLAITVAVAFLLVDGQYRDSSFFLSLGFILFAEVALFAGPHLVRTGGGLRMAPWHISMVSIPMGYALGVAAITVAAVRGTPWRILVSAQLVWLLLFLIVMTIVRSTGSRIAQGIETDRGRRASFAGIVSLVDDLGQQAERISSSESAALLGQIRKLREEMRYSAQDSLPEAAPLDLKLKESFAAIASALDTLERDSGNKAAADDAGRQIQIARQTLAHREEVIASAR
jgi:hypothetical protein